MEITAPPSMGTEQADTRRRPETIVGPEQTKFADVRVLDPAKTRSRQAIAGQTTLQARRLAAFGGVSLPFLKAGGPCFRSGASVEPSINRRILHAVLLSADRPHALDHASPTLLDPADYREHPSFRKTPSNFGRAIPRA
jgi:hypothetical protein